MYSQAFATLLFKEKCTKEELIQFLEKKNLLSLLLEISKELKKLREKELTDLEMTIETPFPLNVTSLAKIQQLVGAGDETRVNVKEKKMLLSGFRALYKGHSYDTSARKIISDLRNN